MALLAQLYLAKWLLLAVVALVYGVRKYRMYMRLRAFKGPFSTGWSEVWHICAIASLHSHLWYEDVCKRYGTIARVGPNDLVTTSLELLTHMSSVRSPYTKAAWYYRASRFESGKDHIFSTVDEEHHARRRQQMAAGYSGKENFAIECTIDGCVQELIDLIRTKYLSTEKRSLPMDFARKIQYLALDVISLIGFGQAFGDLKADADVDSYIQSAEEGLSLLNYTAAIGIMPYMQWPLLARLTGPSEKDTGGHGKMMAKARCLIDERLTQPTDKRSDMLASFIRHGLTRDDLFTEAMLQILAGSDTTATAIRGTMLCIMSHPRVHNKLQAEIDAAVTSGTASAASDIISEASANKLEYLQAVIREGLRVHPPVTDVAPKVVPKGGDKVIIDGEHIYLPGNTNIGFCVVGLNRNKKIFGDDVDQFRPERWLVEDQGRLTAMKRVTDLLFGSGRYQCLGKPIAWMEINKTIFELLRHFDWALAFPEKPWISKNYMGIFVQEEMWVQVTERSV
ncbi:cytochrome P450 [Lojkania enalia]|uniref:Cytochrome P450 monooxygenase ABA1 n=1 Tax=Lojkania enalia TaxID=147567 RepID=A0A9P4NAJ2_9PLEO|nr:cytochrome P450 [Didymosphaeria enalia]